MVANLIVRRGDLEKVFAKYSGSGNDFVMFDNFDGSFDIFDKAAVARYVCRRSISIGADGAIFIERADDGARARMRYFNSDGSEASMCGNGARCTGAFAAKILGESEFPILTGAGIVQCAVADTRFDENFGEQVFVKVQMPDCELLAPALELVIDKLPFLADYYNSGVPHVVFIVEDVAAIPVKQWGRIIRNHRAFAPAGANVDFVEVIDKNTLRVRTYERGVEDETLACGTGCVASAVSAARRNLTTQNICTIVELPDKLSVSFSLDSFGHGRDVRFAGYVIHSFDGTIILPDGLKK